MRRDHGELLEQAARPVKTRITSDSLRVEEPMRSLVLYLKENLFSEELSVEAALRATATGRDSRRTKFRMLFGSTIKKYIEYARMETALRLIAREPQLTAVEVGFLVGYKYENTFRVAFPRVFGIPPGQAQALLRSGELQLPELLRKIAFPGQEESRLLEDDSEISSERSSQRREDEDLLQKLGKKIFSGTDYEAHKEIIGSGLELGHPAVVRGLLRMSRERCRDNRALGVEIAELALVALHVTKNRLAADDYAFLEVEVFVNIANAQRLASDPEGAELAFQHADNARGNLVVPLRLEGDYLLSKGHLRSFQRRFSEAEDLLSSSLERWRELEDDTEVVKTLLAKGICSELSGNTGRAIALYRDAFEIADGKDELDPYLRIAAVWHLSNGHMLAGDTGEARNILRIAEEETAGCSGISLRIHVQWLRCLILVQEENISLAKRGMTHVVEGLDGLSETLNASIARLDLMCISLQQEKLEEAARLAVSALPVLRAASLSDEAVAALTVLEQASANQRVTIEEVLALRQHIEIGSGAPRRRVAPICRL